MDTEEEYQKKCACWKTNIPCGNFQLIAHFGKFGLNVYRRVVKNTATRSNNTFNNFNDVFVIHSANSVQMTNSKFTLELGRNLKICPRCKNLMERAQHVLKYVTITKERDIFGVCTRCSSRKKVSCHNCHKAVKCFTDWKAKQKENTIDHVENWLFKINKVLDEMGNRDSILNVTSPPSHLVNSENYQGDDKSHSKRSCCSTDSIIINRSEIESSNRAAYIHHDHIKCDDDHKIATDLGETLDRARQDFTINIQGIPEQLTSSVNENIEQKHENYWKLKKPLTSSKESFNKKIEYYKTDRIFNEYNRRKFDAKSSNDNKLSNEIPHGKYNTNIGKDESKSSNVFYGSSKTNNQKYTDGQQLHKYDVDYIEETETSLDNDKNYSKICNITDVESDPPNRHIIKILTNTVESEEKRNVNTELATKHTAPRFFPFEDHKKRSNIIDDKQISEDKKYSRSERKRRSYNDTSPAVKYIKTRKTDLSKQQNDIGDENFEYGKKLYVEKINNERNLKDDTKLAAVPSKSNTAWLDENFQENHDVDRKNLIKSSQSTKSLRIDNEGSRIQDKKYLYYKESATIHKSATKTDKQEQNDISLHYKNDTQRQETNKRKNRKTKIDDTGLQLKPPNKETTENLTANINHNKTIFHHGFNKASNSVRQSVIESGYKYVKNRSHSKNNALTIELQKIAKDLNCNIFNSKPRAVTYNVAYNNVFKKKSTNLKNQKSQVEIKLPLNKLNPNKRRQSTFLIDIVDSKVLASSDLDVRDDFSYFFPKSDKAYTRLRRLSIHENLMRKKNMTSKNELKGKDKNGQVEEEVSYKSEDIEDIRKEIESTRTLTKPKKFDTKSIASLTSFVSRASRKSVNREASKVREIQKYDQAVQRKRRPSTKCNDFSSIDFDEIFAKAEEYSYYVPPDFVKTEIKSREGRNTFVQPKRIVQIVLGDKMHFINLNKDISRNKIKSLLSFHFDMSFEDAETKIMKLDDLEGTSRKYGRKGNRKFGKGDGEADSSDEEMMSKQQNNIKQLNLQKGISANKEKPKYDKEVTDTDMPMNTRQQNLSVSKYNNSSDSNFPTGSIEYIIPFDKIKILPPPSDDFILKLIKLTNLSKNTKTTNDMDMEPLISRIYNDHFARNRYFASDHKDLSLNAELELPRQLKDQIIGQKIETPKQIIQENYSYPELNRVNSIFQKRISFANPIQETNKKSQDGHSIKSFMAQPMRELKKSSCILARLMKGDDENSKGVIRYALSDREYIDKGWTQLPTEKVVRKMNVYRMRPAKPEFDWFERNKHKKIMYYDTGEKLAEIDDNARGRWFYKNGRLALDYYFAEETNAQQRFVIYSSGEPDEKGRTHPVTVLAMFDYLGNGVVFDHSGKIRLKYNQTEGVVLDKTLGPVSNWKWHNLNDPPVLQQVMVDTQLSHKDPDILKMTPNEPKTPVENEDMLAIEFDNFIKEKSKKLAQSFKPFQIKMKALKINEHFSLRVLDQSTIYITFRDGPINMKLNIGMILDHQEIVDTDTAELGDVLNSVDRFPARTESLDQMQKSVAYAQRVERMHLERERKIRWPVAVASVDQLMKPASKPLHPPFRAHTRTCNCQCSKRHSSTNIYYDTRLI